MLSDGKTFISAKMKLSLRHRIEEHIMSRKILATSVTFMCLALIASATSFAGRAQKVENAIWANGDIYGTILTDAGFNAPPPHSTDTLYNFGMSGLMGQRAVASSAPRDRDYNGGRWTVMMVSFTTAGMAVHDPDGDGFVNFELNSEAAVLAHVGFGHFTIMDANFYFECPLIP
jgi:hypothetical protein